MASLPCKVSDKGISPDPQKSAAISQHLPPTNVQELKQFLGLASYYQKFIRGFTTVAHPLISLLKKGVEFVWHDVNDIISYEFFFA